MTPSASRGSEPPGEAGGEGGGGGGRGGLVGTTKKDLDNNSESRRQDRQVLRSVDIDDPCCGD